MVNVNVDQYSNMENDTMVINAYSNMTHTYGPPRTIYGIPIETFSYIFLIIGGVAPVAFIMIFIIVSRCYRWRRSKRRQSYGAHVTAIEEFEKVEPQPGQGKAMNNNDSSKNNNNQRFQRNLYMSYGTDMSRAPLVLMPVQSSPAKDSPAPPGNTDTVRSDSNPNVYFKRPVGTKAVAFLPQQGRQSETYAESKIFSPGHSSHKDITTVGFEPELAPSVEVEEGDRNPPVTQRTVSVNSEEARALACFDQIYEDYDSRPDDPNGDGASEHSVTQGGISPPEEVKTASTKADTGADLSAAETTQSTAAGYSNDGYISEGKTEMFHYGTSPGTELGNNSVITVNGTIDGSNSDGQMEVKPEKDLNKSKFINPAYSPD